MFRPCIHGTVSCAISILLLSLIFVYRKNFDRHFQESRHAFGMRALGLPNTKHFHEITGIDDALARKSFLLCNLITFLMCFLSG